VRLLALRCSSIKSNKDLLQVLAPTVGVLGTRGPGRQSDGWSSRWCSVVRPGSFIAVVMMLQYSAHHVPVVAVKPR